MHFVSLCEIDFEHSQESRGRHVDVDVARARDCGEMHASAVDETTAGFEDPRL